MLLSDTDTKLFKSIVLKQLQQKPGTLVQITAFLEACIRPEVAIRFYQNMITYQQEQNARRRLKTTTDFTEQIHLGIREMTRKCISELHRQKKIRRIGGRRYNAKHPTIWAAL